MTSAVRKPISQAALNAMPRVSPSHIDPWHGNPAPGSKWTFEQLNGLSRDRANISPELAAEHEVTLNYDQGFGHPPLVKKVICPILAHGRRTGRDGRPEARILVITPAGHKRWVNAQ